MDMDINMKRAHATGAPAARDTHPQSVTWYHHASAANAQQRSPARARGKAAGRRWRPAVPSRATYGPGGISASAMTIYPCGPAFIGPAQTGTRDPRRHARAARAPARPAAGDPPTRAHALARLRPLVGAPSPRAPPPSPRWRLLPSGLDRPARVVPADRARGTRNWPPEKNVPGRPPHSAGFVARGPRGGGPMRGRPRRRAGGRRRAPHEPAWPCRRPAREAVHVLHLVPPLATHASKEATGLLPEDSGGRFHPFCHATFACTSN